MLVLDRKVQEGFWIGGGIFVKVLGIGRRRVKLGIDAPGEFNIVRGELMSTNGTFQMSSEAAPEPPEDEHTEGSFRSVRRRN